MSADDLAVAREFLDVLAAAARSGELEDVYPWLAPDVEWVTPLRDLHSVGELRGTRPWIRQEEAFEIDFDEPTLTDLGSGRVRSEFRQLYRVRRTGELAYARDRRIELTVRGGKIARYELRFAG